MREAAGEKEFIPFTGCGDQGKVTSNRDGLWASGQMAGARADWQQEIRRCGGIT